MARSILTSHVREGRYRKEVFFSFLSHGVLLLFFLLGAELFPAREVLLAGSGTGGGQAPDFLSVGLTGELGGGEGMYKPALTPRPEASPPPPPRKKTVSPPLPTAPNEFLEKVEPKKRRKVKTSRQPSRVKKKKATAKPGQIPGRSEPGSGGSGGGAPGSGGGFGGGQGVVIGTGTGEGVMESWYARRVEQRVGSNWLKTSLGQLGKRVRTTVSFLVVSDGTIANVRVERGSGIRSVDLAAQRAVRASNPLPPLPYAFRGRRVRFVAHFEYPPR